MILQAAGDGARQVGTPIPLRVEREPGHLDNDPDSRRAGVSRLLDSAFAVAKSTPALGDGRDLVGLLTAISATRGDDSAEVWLSTLGLGTVAPADARVLMSSDPTQAADSVAAALPSGLLQRTTVHLVLSAPVGNQPWFNPRTNAWRSTFVVDLLRDLGAIVDSVQEDLTTRPSRPNAPPAPVIDNLPETNPRPASAPVSSGAPMAVPLDNAALFEPDTATFVDGEAAVVNALSSLIDAVRSGHYGRVEVTGRCARFGAAETARELSMHRAMAVADLLRRAGVPVEGADVHGLGFDAPLPPDPQAATNRSVTVTTYPRD
ncbi:OmpA family protein [Pseudonocardia sp. GCM10023141]|uniref:OmpA family protein n=1 Tax=Pseudonocardia sp. GCM10023141 TaxID=3252653 RepID=UPI0036D42CA5